MSPIAGAPASKYAHLGVTDQVVSALKAQEAERKAAESKAARDAEQAKAE